MKCKYCEREIANKGSLVSHEMCCKNNPDRKQHQHSPLAGKKKGSIAWNKGMHNKSEINDRNKHIIENGLLSNYCEAVARRRAKQYLIELNGHVCSRCGTSDWMGDPVPLVCDHISGDSTDNRIENFRLICNNCDGQLPTFKSKNKGKGRKYDRDYRRNKSESNQQIK